MKRLIALAGILAVAASVVALTMFTTPARADTLPPGLPCTPTANGNGAASCTINVHPISLPFFAGQCVPAELNGANVLGNAVFHVTQNTATDFWITTTNEGTFTGLPAGFSGRATQWFGDENNSQNQVVHAIADGQVTDPSGVTIHFHETLHFSISASGQQSPVMFDNCTAS
ncbi:MAG TPA: hypothetical protein VGS80_16195 [Ktedonobacterales bacterium]|nr:hypothetical protein [Ktedonobacterales bacterium]